MECPLRLASNDSGADDMTLTSQAMRTGSDRFQVGWRLHIRNLRFLNDGFTNIESPLDAETEATALKIGTNRDRGQSSELKHRAVGDRIAGTKVAACSMSASRRKQTSRAPGLAIRRFTMSKPKHQTLSGQCAIPKEQLGRMPFASKPRVQSCRPELASGKITFEHC